LDVDEAYITAVYSNGDRVQLLVNSGFEWNEGWIFPDTPVPGRYSTQNPYRGSRNARVGLDEGADNIESYSSGRQRFNVPSN
jgi:hypothetical protein